jgi:hypothetical protein
MTTRSVCEITKLLMADDAVEKIYAVLGENEPCTDHVGLGIGLAVNTTVRELRINHHTFTNTAFCAGLKKNTTLEALCLDRRHCHAG